MLRIDVSCSIIYWIKRFAVWVLLGCAMTVAPGVAAVQAETVVSPDATPEIQQINPNQAVPGARVTVTIQGRNFSMGVYVSSVAAAVHVESSRRLSATQLEAHLNVGAAAQSGTVSLLVSNPASRTAEVAFKIVAGTVEPTPLPPVEPAPPVGPVATIKPSAPPAAITPGAPPGPEVTSVAPHQVGPGNDIDLKVTGRNFSAGTKVSFANPGIRVLGVITSSGTEIVVHIRVARDIAAGATSLYVVNPDDREVEAPFEVAAKGIVTAVLRTTSTGPAGSIAGAEQRFAAFHLGSPAEVFQTHGKVKGELVVSSGTLQYQEGSATLVNMSLSEIKEIRVSAVANATFHVTLNSGKTYHFAPSSLRPSDARNIVDSLCKALSKPKATLDIH